MGARGKKRVRANGEVASGKYRASPRPAFVPAVAVEELEDGLAVLQGAVEGAGRPRPPSDGWNAAYRDAQALLNGRYERLVADAILWRATFLDALSGWDEFRQRHGELGVLPSRAMLEVAASIPTHGAETSFDVELFEDWLADRLEGAD